MNGPIDPQRLRAAAEAILDDVIEIRRRLHRRPEIGLHLPETQAVIADALRDLGLEPRLGVSTTSVVALIEGATAGPTTLLRADMDGLPLSEDTGLPFASEVAGAMHACGHDGHAYAATANCVNRIPSSATQAKTERRKALIGVRL